MAKKVYAKTNAEIESKLKAEKTVEQQVVWMESFIEMMERTKDMDKNFRELEALKLMYPFLCRSIMEKDMLACRVDYLPVGFGCVTSVGGVGYYCHYRNLNLLRESTDDPDLIERMNKIEDYFTGNTIGERFKGVYPTPIPSNSEDEPLLLGIRLSGMMLDYKKFCANGVKGMKEMIAKRIEEEPDNNFLKATYEAMDLFTVVCDHYINMIDGMLPTASEKRKYELVRMQDSLKRIRVDKPVHFIDALHCVWIYAYLAGCINYGRLDEVVGDYLVADLESGFITREEAHDLVRSLWVLIENKRTTVNGRLIVGGRGRHNPKAADEFARICLDVCKEMRQVEPQFTLRLYEDTPKDIWDKAMECLADGATFPTLYNDEVHVPGLANCMRVSEKEAEQYAMFGCGEMNLQGMTVGTPNAGHNLLKSLTIFLNEGIDPYDNRYKAGDFKLKKLEEYETYEQFWNDFSDFIKYMTDIIATSQANSYIMQNNEMSYLMVSAMMQDCIERGKPVLGGGIKYLGGCNETYGNINCSDSLYALKKLVFDQKKYTLREVNNALLADFEGYEQMQQDMKDCEKYGNDCEPVDKIANDLFELVGKENYEAGPRHGLHHYGIVIINNQQNTSWGLKTWASPDGRKAKTFMNPSNNPQGGADKSGPTAMLNSLAKFDAHWQVGQVQNIKFQKNFFKDNIDKIGMLFKGYFKKGGCQLMVTVIDHHALEDAMVHPENHQNLIVRVSGFSAVFVNLDKSVQLELLSRTMYDQV
ncbi:MAG: pyruvate formate-lyase [Erysipelotrichaceae bacterium]|nr:pyruvate formate-lyase [Erysipelotrichaceae bacterium]